MTTTRDSMIQAFTYPELPTVTLSPVRGKPRAARGHDSDQLSYRRMSCCRRPLRTIPSRHT